VKCEKPGKKMLMPVYLKESVQPTDFLVEYKTTESPFFANLLLPRVKTP
jgi:hypothetical protein